MRTARLLAGFAMVETMVTVVVVAFGLLGVAGLVSRSFVAEVEGTQRTQAVLLLQDMVTRIEANRTNVAGYVTGDAGVTGYVTTTDGTTTTTAQVVCDPAASLADRDRCEWGRMLAGANEQAGRAAAAIREAQSQAAEANFQFRQEALNERSQVEQKIAVNEQSLGGQGPLGRRELRSPVDGVVNDVKVTTIGGFVNAGEKVMEVVPVGEKLLVETRVKPSDIAFIKVGDKALVKVTAYDFSTYGGLDGKVVQVSADSIYDEVEKQAYFTVIVETERNFLQSGAHRLPIAPGMMTDTQIITGRKSVLSYLLKPVLKARSEALRER